MAVRLTVAGSGGRMGQAVLEAVLADAGFRLAGALEVPGNALLGRDAGERIGAVTGVTIPADIPMAVARADVLIDFTRPEGTLAHLGACAQARVAAVVGTTGLTSSAKRALGGYGGNIPIAFVP